MKFTTGSLLISIFLLQLMVLVNTDGALDTVMERKVNETRSRRDTSLASGPKTLSCTSVKSMSKFVACPAGMSATGCSCGFACGSWEIQHENTCNCLCLLVDWASARCCKLS